MATNQIKLVINATDNSSTALKALANNINQVKNGISSLGNDTTNATNSVTKLNSSAVKTPGVFSRITNAAKSMFGGITGGGKDSSSSIQDVNSSMGETESAFSRVKDAAARAFEVFSGYRVVSTIFNTITSQINGAFTRLDTMDVFKRKMEMITNSSETATYALEKLKEATTGTPYALDAAAQAVQNFVVRGLETKDAVSSVSIWMDAVSAYGNGTTETFNSVIDAIGKMRTKGTVEMRYLNRLFAAGINPVQMYAKATGKSAAEVQAALSDKTINTEDFLNTVETAMREGTNGVLVVEGMAKRLASTWSATFTNMRIAITRGWTYIIEALNDTFKMFNENGLKGIISGFGKTVEKIMNQIANILRVTLKPVMAIFAEMFNYFDTYFLKPFRDSFTKFKQPINDTIGQIQESFKGIRTSFSQEWNKITQSLKISPVSVDFGGLSLQFLQKINEGLNAFRQIIPDIMKLLGPAIITGAHALDLFNNLVEVVIKSVIQLGRRMGAIIVPKAIPVIAKSFRIVVTVITELINGVKMFVQLLTPLVDVFANVFGGLIDYMGELLDAWNEWLNSIDFAGLSNLLARLSNNIVDILGKATETIHGFFASFGNKQKFTSTIDLNIETNNNHSGLEFINVVSSIFENLVKLVTRSITALRPLIEGFYELFTGKGVQMGGLSDALFNVLGIVNAITENLATNVPNWVNQFAVFGERVLSYVAPIGAFLWDLITNYIVPFGMALFNAFGSIAIALLPIAEGILAVGLAIAKIVVPAALVILTSIFNWIADHASLVAGGILAITVAFLTFKLISFVGSVIQGIAGALSLLRVVILEQIIPAIITFFQVWQTQGLVAAFSNLANPIFWIGLLVAAIAALVVYLIYLWNTSEQARTVISRAWQVICDAFKAVVYVAFLPFITAGKLLLQAIEWLMDVCEPFANAVNQVKDALTGWFDWITGKDVAGQTNQAVNEGNQALASGAEGMGGIGADYMTNFTQGITNNMPDMGAMGNQLATDFSSSAQGTLDANQFDFSSYLAQLDGIDTTGSGAAIPTGIAEGVTNNQGILDETLANMTGGMQNQLNMTFSTEAVSQTASNFVNTIAIVLTEQAPTLYTTAGNMGTATVNEFNTQMQGAIPTVYEKGANMLNTFMRGMTDTYPDLIQQVKDIARQLKEPLETLPDTFYQYGHNSIVRFNNGLSDNINSVIQPIFDMKAKTLEELRGIPEASYDIGRSTMESFNNGIKNNQDTVSQAFTELMNNVSITMQTSMTSLSSSFQLIATTLMSDFERTIRLGFDNIVHVVAEKRQEIIITMDRIVPEFGKIGDDMMSGLELSIIGNTAKVVSATSELVQQMKDTFINGLGIHSPSRFTQYVADMMGAGLLKGLTQDQIKKWTEGLVGQIRGSFDKRTLDPFSTVDFLKDDTVALIGYLTDVDTSAASTTANNGQLTWPLPGQPLHVNSPFGHRSSPGGVGSTNHQGVDLQASRGQQVIAALPGTVTTAGPSGGYGIAVKLDHGNGIGTVYGHFQGTATNVGAQVQAGQLIGYADSTGNSTGDHLHFEIRQNGNPVDPVPYLQGAAQVSGIIGDPLSNVLQYVLQMYQGAQDKLHWRDGLEGLDDVPMLGGGSLNTAGSGLIEPDWFKTWTPPEKVARWASVVSQALMILGEPQSLLKGVLWAINGESGGNPNDINLWDSNAAIGDPTKGLLQIMMANFKPRSQGGWGVEGHTNNIWDPLENILTGLGEMKWKPIYANSGGIAGVINRRLAQGSWSGYRVGSRYIPYDMPAYVHQGEAILPANQNPYTNSGGDYMRDLVQQMWENNNSPYGGVQGNFGQQSSNVNQTITINAPINIDIDGDTDSTEIADNIAAELHRALVDAIAVGNPR